MKCEGQSFIFCQNNPKNNFEKMKKTLGDIMILHLCTTNNNHMMYMVPEIKSTTDRIFCHFGPFFALLPP